MSFAYPLVLLALVLPAALLWLVWSRRTGRLALPLDHAGTKPGTGLRVAIAIAESIPPLLLAVAILLIAGPLEQAAPKARRKLSNIQFCLDVSGSMVAEFGAGNRYDAAMAAINGFLDFREGDAFGLTFFGNQVLHWVPLTSDVSAFRCAPPFMDPTSPNRAPGFGGTEIGKALLECRDVLTTRETGDRMIILVSDGMSADLNGDAPQEVARKLKGDGIVVYAIHIAPGDVPPPIVDITTLTGGQAFFADDPNALATVFQRIDEMEPAELEKGVPEQVDWFLPFCIVGLALLGTHLLAQTALRYTPW